MDGGDRARYVRGQLEAAGLFDAAAGRRWRVAGEPFRLEPEILDFLHRLGPHLLAFYRAANRLYQAADRGLLPSWVLEYLHLGKTEQAIDLGRIRRWRRSLPPILRPDLLLTGAGCVATELDSVPGGFGNLACMQQAYAELGFEPLGGARGIVDAFWEALAAQAGRPEPLAAIVVSDESADYRPEMRWLAQRLRDLGHEAHSAAPHELRFDEERGLLLEAASGRPLDVVYRFFELFDLKNIPKSDLLLYAARKGRLLLTPPPKHYLEEKLLLALFHHPALADFWAGELGAEGDAFLRQVLPRTWIVDPRPLPPQAVIAGLEVGGRPLQEWRQLAEAGQRDRRWVLKPSGFSPLSWGSRGVAVGHDLSQERWAEAVARACDSFATGPYVLQPFQKSRRFPVEALGPDGEVYAPLEARMRLCPYYMVIGDEVRLAGALATLSPADKKVIHGMVDAVMVPVGL